jgi:GT2 family glycosyltransferase
MTSLDIVLVNWNAGEQLRDCLASVASVVDARQVGRVVVVDNASSDGSLDGLTRCGLPLEVVRNRANRGFAAACNQGGRAGTSEYLLFLNPDTRLFAGSLETPLAFLARPENRGVGICGVQLVDADQRVLHSCSSFPTLCALLCQAVGFSRLAPRWFPGLHMQNWDHATTRQVDHVIGAFFMIRRAVFEQLGGFDERFFVYLEDLDLSLRAREAGWRTVYLADARAFHRGGGTSEQAKARRLFYALRSRVLYAGKHFSALGAGLVTAVTLLVEPWTRLLRSVLRLSPREAWETAAAYVLLWGSMLPIPTMSHRRRFSVHGEASQL